MALTNSTTLTGKEAQELYARIFFDMPTLNGTVSFRANSFRNGHVMFFPNVKSLVKIPMLDVTSGLKARSCMFVASGDDDLSDKEISPCALAINKEVCKTDFDGIYDNEGMFEQPPGALASTVPAAYQNAFLEAHGGAVSEHAELLVWQGDTEALVDGPEGEDLTLCDGFLIRMIDVLGDPATLVPAPFTIDESNVIDALKATFLTLNPRVHQFHARTGEGRIFISPQTDLYLRIAIGEGFVNTPLLTEEDGLMIYNKWPIVVSYGIPDDVIVMTHRRNLWVATDLISDILSLQIIDLQATTGDRIVRYLGEFKLGVNYYRGDYIALFNGRP